MCPDAPIHSKYASYLIPTRVPLLCPFFKQNHILRFPLNDTLFKRDDGWTDGRTLGTRTGLACLRDRECSI